MKAPLLLPFLLALSSASAQPLLNAVNVLTPTVECYGKFEASVDLSATFDNPYDYDQVSVSATFTSPSGESSTVDGFYMQPYSINASNGSLSPQGEAGFRLRFSPGETGDWAFTVSVTDSTGMATASPQSFQCSAVSSPHNHGFVRTGASNYLRFDDGEQCIPIGENIAWQNNNAYQNYKAWLDGLSESGGNFLRLWHAHWGLGLEWKNGSAGFEGLRRYKQTNCRYQDWLFERCAEDGIYVMLALQHHGTVSTQVNPNWDDSPYNAANGGPCQSTVEFFTNEESRAHTRNRYRYIVARWGYSRAILCWELFNEVLWTDDFEANKPLVADWHFDMTDYLQSIDPHGHIVTTSYGGDLSDEDVWAYPGTGLTQTHIYLNTPHIERALAQANRSHLQAFGKPTLNGEFGLGGSADLANADPSGIHFHNSLWGGLFSGGLGTAMSWWWDSYIHPKDLYHHFSGVAQVAAEVPFVAENLAPTSASVIGAPGDLSLTPTLGWSGIGEAEVTIDASGGISPAGAALGQFLYGSQWNTQFRSPPTFHVDYPSIGQFRVRTGPEVATSPKIAIWLDGLLQLEQVATPNTDYTITVPMGQHDLKVDNTGTDWAMVASYTFEGLGSQVDAYVLLSANKQVAAGWALNNAYNHESIAQNGLPPAVAEAAELLVGGFNDGSYTVRWFDPLTGMLYGGEPVQAAGGQLSLPLPAFVWDVAFLVDSSPVPTAERVSQSHLRFEVSPNPARAGQVLTLLLPSANEFSGDVWLLDASGRRLASGNGGQLRLPEDLAAGLYWVLLRDGRRAGAAAVVAVD